LTFADWFFGVKSRAELDVSDEADLCTFCYPPEDRKILYEDEKVYVIASLGHFIPGYLLLINKEHVDCFAEVWDEDRIEVKNKIRQVLEEEYGACCFFEHGRTGSCIDRGTNKICYHGHVHCLPIKEDFSTLIEEDYDRIEVQNLNELSELREKHPHYLFLEAGSGKKKYFPVDEYAESQYLRKKACESLGLDKEKANWRKNPFRSKMKNTSGTLSEKL
jgi:diadenosine tetraphosphate (Ap4A) HIT family hydrolase